MNEEEGWQTGEPGWDDCDKKVICIIDGVSFTGVMMVEAIRDEDFEHPEGWVQLDDGRRIDVSKVSRWRLR